MTEPPVCRDDQWRETVEWRVVVFGILVLIATGFFLAWGIIASARFIQGW